MSALKTHKHKETKMAHTLPELKWRLPRRTQRSNEWPLWVVGVGETYFRDDAWWAEFTGPATGLTVNFLFLPVNFLFFIIYNLAKVTPATEKRNCENQLARQHQQWTQTQPWSSWRGPNTQNETQGAYILEVKCLFLGVDSQKWCFNSTCEQKRSHKSQGWKWI